MAGMSRRGDVRSAPEDHESLAGNEKIVVDGFWAKVGGRAGRLSVINEAAAGYYAMRDKRTPMRAKATLAAALAYFVLPIDAVPDVLLGLGFTDDIAVLTLALATVRSAVRPEHRAQAQARLTGRVGPESD